MTFPEKVQLEDEMIPDQLRVGFWGYTRYYTVNGTNNQYLVEGCASFPEEITFDSAFVSARVFAIMTPIFTTLSALLVCQMSGATDKRVNYCLCAPLLLATIFSGLSLLVFSSFICETKNWDLEGYMGNQRCILGPGAIIVIVNTILLFIATVLVFLTPRGDYESGEEEKDAEDKPAEEDEEEPKKEEEPKE